MNGNPSPEAAPRLPQICAVIAVGIAVLALAGWQMNARFLAGQWGPYIPMAPSTALAFLLLGGALFCTARWPAQRLSRLFALAAVSLVSLLALLVLAQFSAGIDLGVEGALSRTNEVLGGAPLGRMSPLTASAFLLEGAALFILLVGQRWRNAPAAAALLALLATAVNFVVLAGYAYGAPLLYGGTNIPVALPTAIAFVWVGLGQITLAAPSAPALAAWSRTTLRGRLLRAFLPSLLVLLLVEGWLEVAIEPFLSLNRALWHSLMALTAGALIVAVTGWIAGRTGDDLEQAQESLRLNEARFRALLENSSDGITVVNANGAVTYTSPALSRILGYTPDERLGHNVSELMHPDEVSTNLAQLGQLLQKPGGRVTTQSRFRRQDGTWRWLDVTGVNLLNEPAVRGIVGNYRDITQRRRTEEALRESESLLRESQLIAGLGSYVLDFSTGAWESSDILDRIFGIDETYVRSVEGWADLVHPAERQQMMDYFTNDVIGRRARFDKEYRIIRKNDQAERWVHGVGQLEVDAQNQLLKMHGTITDITERKQVEKERTRLSNALEASLNEIYLFHAETLRFEHANAGALRNLGYSRAAIETMTPLDLKPEFDEVSFRNLLAPLLAHESEQLVFQTVHRRADGSLYPVEVHLQLVEQDGARTFLAVILDITERKRAETAQIESSAQFRALFEASPDAILLIDPHDRWPILDCNRAACTMNGYTRDELVGQSIDVLNLTPGDPTERGEYLERIRQSGVRHIETFHRRKDGAVFPVEVSTSMIALGGREVVLGIDRDITERKQIEEALRENEQRLQVALSSVDLAVFHQDSALRYTWMYQPQLGYRPEQVVGHTDAELLPPEAARQVTEIKQRVLETGARAHEEVSVAAAGTTFVYDLVAEPLRNASGEIIGLTGATLDITERKQAEATLREQESRYRGLFEHSPISLWEEDFSAVKQRLEALRRQGVEDFHAFLTRHPEIVAECAALVKIIDVNHATLKLYHARSESELLTNLDRIFNPESYDTFRNELVHIAEGHAEFHQEGTNRGLTGETLYISLRWSAAPGYEDSLARVFVSIVDITERKQAEEQIQRRNSELTALNEIGRILSRLASASEIVERLFTVIGQVLDNRNLYIALYDEATQTLSFPVYTIQGERREVNSRPFGNGLTEYVIRSGAPLLIPRNQPAFLAERGIELVGTPSKCFLAAPMRVGERVTGVIAIQDYENEDIYHASHAELMDTLAAQAAIALENSRLYVAVQRELDERKRTEAALRLSEEKYRTLVDEVNDGFYVTDRAGVFTFANPALARMHGFESPEALVGRKFTDLVAPEMQADLGEAYRTAMQAGRAPEIISGQLMRPDGTRVFIEIKAAFMVEDDQIAGSRGVVRDVTEHKRAESALRRAEENYRSIFENSLNGIFQSTPEGRYLVVNPALARIWGYDSPEDLLASVTDTARQVYVDPDRRLVHTRLLQERGGSVVGFEYQAYRKDGSTVWVSENAHSVVDADGALLYYEGAVEDISERKRVEELLRSAEARYRALFDQSPNGVLLIDVESAKAVEFNDTACKQLGYTREEFAALRISDYDAVETPAVTHRHIQKVLSEGSDDFETRHRTKSGEIRAVHVWAKTLQLGERLAFYCIFQDITDREQAEQALTRLHELLDAAGQMARVGGWELDVERQTLTWTEEVYHIHEVDPATRLNIAEAIDFYAPQARPVIAAAMQAGLDSGAPWDLELPLITAHGRRIWVRTQGAAERRGGRIVRLYGAFQDITKRKQADESRGLQSAALNAVANAVVITDHSGVIEWVNPAFTRLTGYAAAEAIGGDPRLLKSGQHDPAFYQELWATILSGQVWRGEMINRRKDGSLYTEEQSITPVLDETGAILHFVAIKDDITPRKQAEEQIQTQLRHLAALRTIDTVITNSLDLRLTLNVVLEQTTAQLGMDAASVLLLNPHTLTLEYAAGRGFRTDALKHSRLRLGEGQAGRAALERQILHIPDLRARTTGFLRSPYISAEGFVAYYVVPLIAKGNVVGVLEVYHRAPYEAKDEWRTFLETLAGQAAIAVDNAQLFEGLQRANVDLVLAYDATIEGWSHALDLRDKETEGHTQRVTEMTLRLGRALGISDADLVHVRRGALLHDIGKMGVPDGILLKPGKLTDEEWAIMRKHPGFAYDLLSPIVFLRPALDIPHYHHEKWDGTGYPLGLKGEQIPLTARAFAAVDVWDALRSDRPYRAGWPMEKVRDYLQEQSGKHFDPAVVDMFLKMLTEDDADG